MGFTSGTSPKGGPTFNATPQLVADLNTLRAFTEQNGNRRIGTTTQRNALTALEKYDGLEWYDTTLKRLFIYEAGVWLPPGETIELTSQPILNNGGAPQQITGWVIDSSKSVRQASVLSGISGQTISLLSGTYLLTAMITLNNGGVPQGVNGRSFIEVLAGETTLQPRLRANPMSGEDSWAVAGGRTFTATTGVIVSVLLGMAPALAGSQIRFIATRLG